MPISVYYPESITATGRGLFVKQMQLDGCSNGAHLFNDRQYVFSAMNGYGHFEKLAEYFPKDHIIGGTALIGGRLRSGRCELHGGAHAKAMNMCCYDENQTPSARRTADIRRFQGRDPQPDDVDNFLGMCMAKIVFNSVLNTLCTMFLIRFGEFEGSDVAKRMTEELVDEAYSAAEHAGITLLGTRESEVKTILHTAGEAHPLHFPSMYQDLTKGRPTEVDYINGYIARIGREHGYVCKLHEFVTDELHLAERAFAIHHPDVIAAEEASLK